MKPSFLKVKIGLAAISKLKEKIFISVTIPDLKLISMALGLLTKIKVCVSIFCQIIFTL